MTKDLEKSSAMNPNHVLSVKQRADETGAQTLARMMLEPHFRHAGCASAFAGSVVGNEVERPGLMDFVSHMEAVAGKAEDGDLAVASHLLVSQATTLDAMFTELARRAAMNMGDYPSAAERFGRLALKAQSNSRATLEALAKLHQPREQTVRHVNVNEGGQAVVADQFHQHLGGSKDGKTDKQTHATEEARGCAALLGQDAQGDGMSVTCGKGPQAVQDARGRKSRRS